MLFPRTKRRRRRSDSAEAGFTLVEVIVALTILATALVFVVGGLQTGVRAVKLAEQMTQAELLARAKLAELEQFPPSQGGASAQPTSGDFGPENPQFRWNAEVSPFPGDRDLWKFKVAVTWMEKNAPRQVELVTLIPGGESPGSRPGSP